MPCSDLYNHHWNLYILNAPLSAQDREVQARLHAWGHPPRPGPPPPAPHPSAGPGVPVRQVFSEGNGNEHRGSFHGTPRGYAQLIHSPQVAELYHMSINTRNPRYAMPRGRGGGAPARRNNVRRGSEA